MNFKTHFGDDFISPLNFIIPLDHWICGLFTGCQKAPFTAIGFDALMVLVTAQDGSNVRSTIFKDDGEPYDNLN